MKDSLLPFNIEPSTLGAMLCAQLLFGCGDPLIDQVGPRTYLLEDSGLPTTAECPTENVERNDAAQIMEGLGRQTLSFRLDPSPVLLDCSDRRLTNCRPHALEVPPYQVDPRWPDGPRIIPSLWRTDELGQRGWSFWASRLLTDEERQDHDCRGVRALVDVRIDHVDAEMVIGAYSVEYLLSAEFGPECSRLDEEFVAERRRSLTGCTVELGWKGTLLRD